MELLQTKLLTMFLFAGISFLIGLVTWKLSSVLGTKLQGRIQTIITSLLLCFGAGVLLATGLIHILPEVKEGLHETEEKFEKPWLAELCLCSGFFLVYLVEELVHVVLHRTSHTEQIHRTFSMRKSGADHPPLGDTVDSPAPPPLAPLATQETLGDETQKCCENSDECHNDMEQGIAETSINKKYNPKYEVRLSLSTNSMFPNYHSPETVDTRPTASKEKKDSHALQQSDNIVKDLIFVLALNFHEVFEGVAVGLEDDQHDVWTLFAAISAHKFVLTFCVCLELLNHNTKTLFYFLYLLTFTLVSPIGIAIGLVISEVGEKTENHIVITAVLQGLAGGTIIYVVMFEVLQREKVKEVSGVFQLVAVVVGFTVMLSMELIGGHSHDAGHEAVLLHPLANLADGHLHHSLFNSSGSSFHKMVNSTSNNNLAFNNTMIVPLEDIEHDDIHHVHGYEKSPGYLVVPYSPPHTPGLTTPRPDPVLNQILNTTAIQFNFVNSTVQAGKQLSSTTVQAGKQLSSTTLRTIKQIYNVTVRPEVIKSIFNTTVKSIL